MSDNSTVGRTNTGTGGKEKSRKRKKSTSWQPQTVIQFLEIYQQYPILFNTSLEEYHNKVLKGNALQKMLDDVMENKVFDITDLKSLRKKIKSIRDTYRAELTKVQKSEGTGTGVDEVYEPTLVWFQTAHAFLSEHISTRKSSTNMKSITSTTNEERQRDPANHDDDNSRDLDNPPDDSSTPVLGAREAQESTPSVPPPKKKKMSHEKGPFDRCLDRLKLIQSEMKEPTATAIGSNVNETFGKQVTAQMETLSARRQILVRQEIQNVLTKHSILQLDESEEGKIMYVIQQEDGTLIAADDHPSSTIENED